MTVGNHLDYCNYHNHGQEHPVGSLTARGESHVSKHFLFTPWTCLDVISIFRLLAPWLPGQGKLYFELWASINSLSKVSYFSQQGKVKADSMHSLPAFFQWHLKKLKFSFPWIAHLEYSGGRGQRPACIRYGEARILPKKLSTFKNCQVFKALFLSYLASSSTKPLHFPVFTEYNSG